VACCDNVFGGVGAVPREEDQRAEKLAEWFAHELVKEGDRWKGQRRRGPGRTSSSSSTTSAAGGGVVVLESSLVSQTLASIM
jgi:hypothetical protein